MKRYSYGLILLVAILAWAPAAFTQSPISLTKTDAMGNLTNFRWYRYGTSDTATVDLGQDIGVQQSWNFSALHGAPNTDSSYQDYFLPAGQLRAEDFPDAELSSRMIISNLEGGYTTTMTSVSYYKSTAAGGFFLGAAMRQQVSPAPPPPTPADTTMEFHYSNPGRIGFPYGSLGTTLTTRDTTQQTPGFFEYSTLVLDINGFGSATFPDGQVKQVLRIREDRVTLTYAGGSFISREHDRYIHIIAKDFTQLSINVDTAYVHGTTVVNGYNFNQKGSAVSVRPTSRAVPENYQLSQNYPNPFNPATEIAFSLPKAQFVTLEVFTILGAEVATLVNEAMAPGEYSVRFDAAGLPSGLYFYRLAAGGFTQTKKMTLIK